MTDDIVRKLGYLALGTRLKRLGERLQAQTQVLLERAGIDLPASHFPILAAIERLAPVSVGDLTQAIGITQPGVTRLLERLESEGLIRSVQSAPDRRVRAISLDKSGRELMDRARRVAWPKIEAAVAQACAGPDRPLLAQLAALEEALAEVPLEKRAESRAEQRAGRRRASA